MICILGTYIDLEEKLKNKSERINIEYSKGLYRSTLKRKCKLEEKKDDRTVQNYYREFEQQAQYMFEVDIEVAVAYYFIHSFHWKGKPSKDGIDIKTTNLKLIEKKKEKLGNILEYSKRLGSVQILNQDFRGIIKNFNDKNTLLYLDCPYFRTAQYDIIFTDRDHIDLFNLLKHYKGKWIFSCRSKINTRKANYDDADHKKHADLVVYLSSFVNYGYYVIEIKKYGINELMITNFKFKHKDVRLYDEWFNEWAGEHEYL